MKDSNPIKTGNSLDVAWLLLAALLLVAGVYAYYAFEELPIFVRVGGVLVSLALAAVVLLRTARGQNAWQFVQSSRAELRKVVWPNRQETMQTTATVLVIVLILCVFFWLLDMGLAAITRQFTGA
ncbi:MAG: preprotein translocase subunit SecE [Gammaproteobacteria bacterium]|nr:preprotein translocase subunit SecE [Gammaproteobacteria bacterium]MXW47037.1 preprotein translocase subunit SecE [Gammaproteobacteria bacterium]MYD02581.1 preprotein translocase subunit SecE [Gammaproteobacteria bacterium]MYI24297.1 preprotein translocase subunit SecE [Gammaproteobacteria bacterium]